MGKQPPRATPRFTLKPDVPATGFVDGAWWPRSRSLPTELPALLAALSDVVGQVGVVGYHVKAWDQAASGVEFEGRMVRLEGFTAEDPHTVLVIGTDGRRIALLVVPPDTIDAGAQDALSTASRPDHNERGGEAQDSAARSLSEVATRLSRREGANERRTAQISNWVDEAAEQFVHAPVQSYVPILVEHIVRGRLARSSDPTSQ